MALAACSDEPTQAPDRAHARAPAPSRSAVGSAAFAVTKRDLGTLGGRNSRAIGINENGLVVGWSQTSTGARRAFKWTAAGGMRALRTLAAGKPCAAQHANRLGQVVGWCNDAAGRQRAVLWSPSGAVHDLGTLPGGTTSAATDINDNGVVSGYGSAPDGDGVHAFKWTSAGGIQRLSEEIPYCPDEPYPSSYAYRINESGYIVGTGGAGGCGVNESAVVWNPAGLIGGSGGSGARPLARAASASSIGTSSHCAGSDYSHGRGINNLGHAVGWAYAEDDSGNCGNFGFRNGQVLSPLPGDEGSQAFAINDQDLVVGLSYGYGTRAVVWSATNAVQNLGTLAGGTQSSANDINNSNRVVGWSTTSNGATHAVLWTLR